MLFPPLSVLGNLQWHRDGWDQPGKPELQSSGGLGAGPALILVSWGSGIWYL